MAEVAKRLVSQRDRLLESFTSSLEKTILDLYLTSLADITSRLQTFYDKHSSDGVIEPAKLTKYNRLKNLQAAITDDVEKHLIAVDRNIKLQSQSILTNAYLYETFNISKTLNLDLKWSFSTTKAIEELWQYPMSKFYDVRELTNDRRTKLNAIRKKVSEGLTNRKSYAEISRTLRDYIIPSKREGGLVFQSLRVARTETHRALVAGLEQSFNEATQMGLEPLKRWLATLDDRTRDSHGAMDGELSDASGIFDTPWGQTRGPGLEGPAEQVINCRCTWITAINNETPTNRYIRGDGRVGYRTFSEWKKSR